MLLLANLIYRDRVYADAPPAAPAAAPPAPLLDQISRETQSLFQSVRSGLVVVELPPPQWIDPFTDANSPMQKWGGRLDPDFLAKLHAQLRAASSGATSVGAVLATSQPASSQPAVGKDVGPQPPPNASRPLLIRRPDGDFELVTPGAPAYDAIIGQMAGPRFLGLVLDDSGHVLIPIFIDKDALQGRPMHVFNSQSKPVVARFVGSDRQTNLTVIQLQSPLGTPVVLAGDRPAEGSLVMLLSLTGDSGHLSIWTGAEQERGLLVSTSGSVGGFARMGQFLSGDAVRPIVDQLIQYGKVRRAALGVAIRQSETPDGHPAMLIEHVIEASAAAEGGLRDGDFIVSLAGVPVADVSSFAAAIAQGDGPTDLQIVRNGQSATVTVNLKPQ